MSDGALYRTKIHCYFLDQSRVVKPLPMERNYHVFYQMLAGLTAEERKQLGLDGLGVRDFAYLCQGDAREPADPAGDAQRFLDWKASLAVLGIPFFDVVRVLSCILLLGNIEFVGGGRDSSEAYDVDIVGRDELNAAASLLAVPTTLLCQGLTSRTHNVRGQPVTSMSDANLVRDQPKHRHVHLLTSFPSSVQCDSQTPWPRRSTAAPSPPSSAGPTA